MTAEVVTVGRLWDLFEAFRDGQRYPPSERQIARELGMSPTAFGNWKAALANLPRPENLSKFAEIIDVSYSRVLDAALHDAGYLPGPSGREVEVLRLQRSIKFHVLSLEEAEEMIRAHAIGGRPGRDIDLVVEAHDEVLLFELKPLAGTNERRRKREALQQLALYAHELQSEKPILGFVVDVGDVKPVVAEDRLVAALADAVGRPDLTDPAAVEAWLTTDLPDAARDVGRMGSVTRIRADQDQAGEPPADDANDIEPR